MNNIISEKLPFLRFLPGLRILKTGLAIFICLGISYLFGLRPSFYAAIAIVISMDKNLSRSFIIGKSRMVGTVIGALLGVIFISFFPLTPFYCALGIVILIFILHLTKLESATITAPIVFIAIMVGFGGNSALEYSWVRLLETLMGIIIAWFVNLLVLPYNNLPLIVRKMAEVKESFGTSFELITQGRRLAKLDALHDSIHDLENEFDIYLHQFTWRKKPFTEVSVSRLIRLLNDAHAELVVLSRLNGDLVSPDYDDEVEIAYGHQFNYVISLKARIDAIYHSLQEKHIIN